MNNCNLTGSLPAQWGSGLPALQLINVSSNALTGTLPSVWSNLNLTAINLDRNDLVGRIPVDWGIMGSFQSLTALQLYSNSLTGALPVTWKAAGTLPSLVFMDVANNNFSGTIPNGWGTSQSTFVTQGNRFCGPTPSYQVFSCGQLQSSCIRNQGISASCPAPPPTLPQVTNVSTASASDITALLKMKAAFTNFDQVVRTPDSLWDPSLPLCASWQGVTCWPDGAVNTVTFSIPALAPPNSSPAAPADANVSSAHASVSHQLAGNIANVLQAASALPRLTKLDFTNQFLTGTLPANISFPSLEELILVNNDITGTLPEAWADGAFPSLRLLVLDLNWRLTGPLPQSWGNSSASMRKLEVFTVAKCNITGTMPVSWVNNLPILSIVDLKYNQLTGSLPQEWQGMEALGSLCFMGNNLVGPLPKQLPSVGGSKAWPFLQELHADKNFLTGSLPASWGSGDSMQALRNLTLSHNNFSGSIPAAWAADPSGHPHFSSLQALVLQPGNPDMCGPVPKGIPLAEGRSEYYNITQVDDYGPLTCPGATSPATSPATSANITAPVATSAPNSGSSISGGAIAGIVIGVCGGLVAAAAILWLFVVRRRARKATSAESARIIHPKKDFSMSAKAALMSPEDLEQLDSDSIIPPQSENARHSYVPFIQAPSSVNSLPLTSSGEITYSTSSSGRGSSGKGSNQPLIEHRSPPQRASSQDVALPSMVGFKDWELDLDALEVELDEEGREVELGRGAFGVVVKGTYRLAPVAIKRLRDQSPQQQQSFLNEMAILRACRGSRYIIPFVGASLLPGNTILAMDFMDNGNLWDALPRIGRHGQPIFQWYFRGKRVAHEIVLGLHFLHEVRVVHLDLKSSNVLIAADGTAKISDVGLSAQMKNASHISSMPVAGTWAWVAPEVILGGKVTSKADMFSFGVVLWEIITLERPMWRGNLREIRVPEEAPQEIADLVLRCTAQPEHRPSAAECADIIRPHLLSAAKSGMAPA
ncbi:g4306 [Coccomyxa elongata]